MDAKFHFPRREQDPCLPGASGTILHVANPRRRIPRRSPHGHPRIRLPRHRFSRSGLPDHRAVLAPRARDDSRLHPRGDRHRTLRARHQWRGQRTPGIHGARSRSPPLPDRPGDESEAALGTEGNGFRPRSGPSRRDRSRSGGDPSARRFLLAIGPHPRIWPRSLLDCLRPANPRRARPTANPARTSDPERAPFPGPRDHPPACHGVVPGGREHGGNVRVAGNRSRPWGPHHGRRDWQVRLSPPRRSSPAPEQPEGLRRARPLCGGRLGLPHGPGGPLHGAWYIHARSAPLRHEVQSPGRGDRRPLQKLPPRPLLHLDRDVDQPFFFALSAWPC